MNKLKRIFRSVSVLLIAILLFVCGSCGNRMSLDALALAEYMQWFDQPEKLIINAYEKAEFDGEIYFYIDRGPYDPGDQDSIKLILVYNLSSGTFQKSFWQDMTLGLRSEVKAKWEQRDYAARSVHVFTGEEIESLAKEAADYCNK